ncbi:conserved hypothetical protein [Afipia carboxidovorans OM5]|uniref:DUF2059 domain-containing protein n=1 Tax=Afipia carboxidovorans (strain ATCC 49405 / DSM 1227 / KCTC 32145 / OM5) TaxID=504832 RepID=B6JE07_AFIC5|nr:DUF2059 domain-containing protein [Afipia carboxidovorans]ACI93640.1 conserved hypothetical protein [Afipia carboxidovorans OM5]AEI02672.1 hypothetical protein OCA4_c15320 [Afipia carboxidovorans OM4]AEI06248.1 hypothetical protein OCA5_c15320 [Afipia carboxidovorans OM5]
MKKTIYALLAAGFVGLMASSAFAQSNPNPSAAAIASAKEILTDKHIQELYKEAVPSLVERSKNTLLQSNLNYQKDLNEVALKVAKDMAGREKEIGDQIAKIYASRFTEQELKELVAWYKSPLGKKVIEQEPQIFAAARGFMDQWAQTFSQQVIDKFRAEMKARGKAI